MSPQALEIIIVLVIIICLTGCISAVIRKNNKFTQAMEFYSDVDATKRVRLCHMESQEGKVCLRVPNLEATRRPEFLRMELRRPVCVRLKGAVNVGFRRKEMV